MRFGSSGERPNTCRRRWNRPRRAAPAASRDDRLAATIAWITSVRSDGTISSEPGPIALHEVARLHGADRHVLDDAVQVLALVEHLPFDLLDEHRQRRVRQQRPVRQHPQQLDAVLGQAVAQDVGESRVRVRVDLVDDRAGDLDAMAGEQRAIEHDLVDGTADSRLGHDRRRCLEHARDLGVRKPDHRPDAGMTRPLDQQEVVRVGQGGVRASDAAGQVRRDLAADVGLGEAAWDVDRAHHRQRIRRDRAPPS